MGPHAHLRGTFLDIAIVGCGISGMAAGVLLADAGHRVTLFERFDSPRAVGSGLLLQPLGLAVLRRIGVESRIRAAGARIDRLLGHRHPGRLRILDVRLEDVGQGVHGIGIHRASLFDALHEAVLRSAATVVTGTPVRAVDRGAGGRPILVDEEGRRHGPFDLAVDASGARSPFRPLVEARPRIRPFAFGALWTTVPVTGTAFDRATLAQRYVAARQMVGVMPVGARPGAEGPHAAFFWSIRRDGLDVWRSGGLARWKDAVAAIWPEASRLLDAVDDPEEMTPAFYLHATVRRPVGDRLALIGDAAHATSPQLGQGANMGLLDAAALADALAANPQLERALSAYLAARRSHVRFYQAASRWMTPLFQSDSAVAAAVRDIAFPAARAVPYLRRDIAFGLAGLKASIFARIAVTN